MIGPDRPRPPSQPESPVGQARPPRTPLSAATYETSALLAELVQTTSPARGRPRLRPGAAGEESPEAQAMAELPGVDELSAHAIRAAMHVHQHGERTVGELAAGLGISYGWASRVVEELEALGYFIRERDRNDRRVVRVRLEPTARGNVERAFRWRGEVVERALAPLTSAEREVINRFLRQVIESFHHGPPARE